MTLYVHCGLGQLSPLPTSGDDKWVAAKHCGRAKRSGISDTHRLRSSLQFRYINNQSLLLLYSEYQTESLILELNAEPTHLKGCLKFPTLLISQPVWFWVDFEKFSSLIQQANYTLGTQPISDTSWYCHTIWIFYILFHRCFIHNTIWTASPASIFITSSRYADDSQLSLLTAYRLLTACWQHADSIAASASMLVYLLCFPALYQWPVSQSLQVRLNQLGTHHRLRTFPVISAVKIADIDINIFNEITSLRVIMDSKLTLDSHISAICKSCYCHLRSLRHIRRSFTQDMAISVAVIAIV